MKMTGAQAIMQALVENQVDVVFGYPGGAIMLLYDALYDFKDQIHHVLVRHEQGAVHAAEGYARACGKPGVCVATSGPGATNLITGITDAMMDSVPLVCITGQVESLFLGTDAFQEADILSMTAPVTKWSVQVTSAEEIPSCLAKAFYLAKSGRPGPVVVDITKDAQLGTLDFSYPRYEGKQKEVLKPDSVAIQEAAKLLNQSSRPYLLVGHGVLISGAEKEVRELAEKADIPVASTLLGLSAFPTNHPLYAGMLGMHGNYGPNVLTNEADVILAVGMRFDDRVTGALEKYAKQTKIIHIDIDQSELDKNVKAAVPILADAKSALQALLPLLQSRRHPAWLEKFKECKRLEHEKVIEGEVNPKEGKLKMGEVIHCLSQKDRGKAIVVTDVGQHQMVAARYCDFLMTNSHITSGGLGTMGFALPAAIGAKLGGPSREVIAVIGDGGFQMTLQELGVISQEKLPVKILILNNQYLGMVRQWQELFFKERYSFTEMHNPDFIKIAEAYGIRARKVTERGDLSEALTDMLASKEAYLLEVVVEKQHNVFPMIPPGASACEVRLE